MALGTAPLSCSASKDNFLRLVKLFIEGGKHTLKEKSDSIHPPANLPTVLLANKALLTNPTTGLFKAQKDKLYPSSGKCGTSEAFDISLLSVLFREICSLTPPALTGWNNLPSATDLSIEADLVRVKYYRNTIYGHASAMELDQASFQSQWKDIRDVILRIAQSVNPAVETQWKQIVKNWETRPLTFSDENHVQELQEWHQFDMDVKEALRHLNTVSQEHAAALGRVENDSKNCAQTVERIEENRKEHAVALGRVEIDSRKSAQTIERIEENAKEHAATLGRVENDSRNKALTIERIDENTKEHAVALERVESDARKRARVLERIEENTKEHAAALGRVSEDARDFTRTLSSVDRGVRKIGLDVGRTAELSQRTFYGVQQPV